MQAAKIKLCYCISSLCNEGPVNVMYNIISKLDFSRFEVSIVTLIPEKTTTRIDDFRALSVRIHQLTQTKKLAVPALYLKLRKKMHEINPDIVHSHCPRSLFLKCFLGGNFKKVYTIHNYPGELQKILYGKIKGTFVIALNHFFTSKMDLPIACAESISKLYKEKHNWNIPAIPNGCSFPISKINEEERLLIRERLSLKPELKYFISIGRFSKEKNHETIIKAIHKLNQPNVGLIVLGDGPLFQNLQEQYGDRVVFPGFKKNVRDYLLAADFYVSASDGEGMPNTLLESMSVGIPVLLSAIPSHIEVISKASKEVGCVFDKANIDDLVLKMQTVLSMDYKSASEELQKIYSEYYTAETMSKAYQAAYISLSLNKKQV